MSDNIYEIRPKTTQIEPNWNEINDIVRHAKDLRSEFIADVVSKAARKIIETADALILSFNQARELADQAHQLADMPIYLRKDMGLDRLHVAAAVTETTETGPQKKLAA
mgnify:CR=1 FL=1